MANSTGNLIAASLTDDADPTNALYLQLKSASVKNQVQIIRDLGAVGESGLATLMRILLDYQQPLTVAPSSTGAAKTPAPDHTVLPIVGTIYQVLFRSGSEAATVFLQTHFPQGIVSLQSEAAIDYTPLQRLLAEQNFQAADQLTLQKMCEVVGTSAIQRKWLYFTEIEQFPTADLQTLNALWLAHSEGRFGFSIQRELWLSVGKNWEQLWSKIGWRSGNLWTRYPEGFTWDLTAPKGHLPLSNQLRGVRGIAALLSHAAWSQD